MNISQFRNCMGWDLKNYEIMDYMDLRTAQSHIHFTQIALVTAAAIASDSGSCS